MEFLELVQGTMAMAQYEAKFNELACFAPHIVVDDTKKAFKFEQGLKPNIRSRLSTLLIQAYSSIVERALIVEDLGDFAAFRDQQQNKR